MIIYDKQHGYRCVLLEKKPEDRKLFYQAEAAFQADNACQMSLAGFNLTLDFSSVPEEEKKKRIQDFKDKLPPFRQHRIKEKLSDKNFLKAADRDFDNEEKLPLVLLREKDDEILANGHLEYEAGSNIVALEVYIFEPNRYNGLVNMFYNSVKRFTAFDTKANIIEGYIKQDNAASIGAAERNGMADTGMTRVIGGALYSVFQKDLSEIGGKVSTSSMDKKELEL